MRVAFLPAIPAFVTDYATERKVDLQGVRMQLSQTIMSVFCDKGVLHAVAGILSETHLRTSMACLEGFTDTLSREVFFLANDTQLIDDLMQLQVLLGERNPEVEGTTFTQVLSLIKPLLIKYNSFMIE